MRKLKPVFSLLKLLIWGTQIAQNSNLAILFQCVKKGVGQSAEFYIGCGFSKENGFDLMEYLLPKLIFNYTIPQILKNIAVIKVRVA